MDNNISNKEKIDRITDYYKDKGLIIVGLNDSQGVNTTSTFFKKGLLEYLATLLTTKELTPKVINAFSLTMNKTEHIDYFLKNNLSLEEIKLSQIYSVVSALEKVMTDLKLPKAIGQVGNAYKLIYTPKKDDSEIKISTSLKEAQEPIMIYSSGVNNLMREVGANPFSIKKSYKLRNQKPNYYYTLEKAKDPETLKKVIDSIERNYNNILDINNNTDIYTLGAYIPKSLQNKDMDIFRYLVIAYNEELLNLCKRYGITFINTEKVGKDYNNSENNFHISTSGHNVLAKCIFEQIYINKTTKENTKTSINTNSFEITNKGLQGIIDATLQDFKKSCQKSIELSGYPSQREKDIAKEHQRETEIFKKVLKKKR
ncbi:MAG: hypothetical protein IKF19_00525 [Bacilli bacterium]|nr:hypothetical protein [Bacilli bacterium]